VKRWAYLAASGQTLIAAGTFLVAKDATALFTPFQLAWFRIMVSGILVWSVYAATHRGRPRPRRADLPSFALIGFLGVCLNQVLFIFGIHLSTPLHAALLYAFTPVLVLAGAVAMSKERVGPRKGAGVALAVAGVVLVLTARGLELSAAPMRGDLLILLAVIAWAGYTLAGKDVLRRYDPFTVITYAFGFAALFALPFTPWAWRGFHPADPGLRGWLELLYLCAMTSGVAFTLWYYALRRLEASQVAVFTNLQAPVTAFLAWLAFGDMPSWQVVFGGVLVLAGVTAVQLPRRPAPARGTAASS
jgi:drug/metabolite transporter (DMT)-like permease